MSKYIIAMILGMALTFFILDYTKLRKQCSTDSVWLYSTRNDVSSLQDDFKRILNLEYPNE